MELILDLYWKAGIILIIFCIAVHYSVVLPFNRKHGKISALAWTTNIYEDELLEDFKKYCLKEGRPLFWYNVLSRIGFFFKFYIAGWLVLLVLYAIFN